jgi:hypothetical protein
LDLAMLNCKLWKLAEPYILPSLDLRWLWRLQSSSLLPFIASFLAYSPTLKVETICSPETSVNFYRTTRCYNQIDHNLRSRNLFNKEVPGSETRIPRSTDWMLCSTTDPCTYRGPVSPTKLRRIYSRGMIPCATNWLMGRRSISFTFSAATNTSAD